MRGVEDQVQADARGAERQHGIEHAGVDVRRGHRLGGLRSADAVLDRHHGGHRGVLHGEAVRGRDEDHAAALERDVALLRDLPRLEHGVGHLGNAVELAGDLAEPRVGVREDRLGRRAHEDGARRAVLGDEVRRLARLVQKDDGGALGGVDDAVAVFVRGIAHGGEGNLGEGRLEAANLVGVRVGSVQKLVLRPVVHAQLGVGGDCRHSGDSLLRERAVGRLAGEHRAVTTIEYGVCDVGHLCACRQRIVAHGLEHLRGADAKLARDVALGDHHLLGKSDLLGGDLHAEVAAGHHDAVGVLEDVVEILHTGAVLDLGDDLDLVTTRFVEDLADQLHVLAGLYKRGGNKVHLVLAAEVLHVVDILFGKHGDIDLYAGKIAVLALAELLGVEHGALEDCVALDVVDTDRD
mmetsp:Transcript_3461/g.15219  ORF Transcript_3461/g.15219 Transcript_3461/m.15219 type:complete len:408 (+) Transcript_3461:529-1752(+)